MKSLVLLFPLLIVVTGCIPLRQETRLSGPDYPPTTLYADRYLVVGIDSNREKIVADGSYIESPAGVRYTIQVEPHPFDLRWEFPTVRANVYPCYADGSRLQHWSNGVWTFHFILEENEIRSVIDQGQKYWIFGHNP